MNKQFFFLSPVEVVKVTSQNLDEVAEWCGGSVQETESRRVQGRMDKYVLVPTPKDTNISWAFPGMFITKRLVVTVKDELRETYAVFRRDYFDKNYFDTPKEATDKTWERQLVEKSKPAKKVEKPVTTNVGEELLKAQARIKELEAAQPKGKNFHDHLVTERCDESHCDTDRYVDGTHVFADVTVETTPEDPMVEPEPTEVKEVEVNRSAVSGQFVTDEEAEANPDTTVTEVVEVKA